MEVTVDQKLFYLLNQVQSGEKKGFEVSKEIQELFDISWKEAKDVA